MKSDTPRDKWMSLSVGFLREARRSAYKHLLAINVLGSIGLVLFLVLLSGCTPRVALEEACRGKYEDRKVTVEGYLLVGHTFRSYCLGDDPYVSCWMEIVDDQSSIGIWLKAGGVISPEAPGVTFYDIDWINAKFCGDETPCSVGKDNTRFQVTGYCSPSANIFLNPRLLVVEDFQDIRPARLYGATSTPTQTSTPRATRSPIPTATPDIPYAELAQQAGFIQFQDNETVQGSIFSFWIPETYEETGGYWETGEFLAEAATSIDDYAYEIYAENTLFIASDTTFYWGSPNANECAQLTNMVDVSRVEFAVRIGQDLQLGNMTIANYAGLLTNAIHSMEWGAVQSSEAFEMPGFEAWRIISNFDHPSRSYHVTFIDYILKDGDRIWVLTFSVDTQLFSEESACAYLIGDFDLIARTFEVAPSED